MLDELRRRVRADPGSRYFLGLAEELLRAGAGAEALAVLDAGLEARPGHVAATVARARCLIALGRPDEARRALDWVLERDPAHLVAAKLAVEAWLREGDRDRARESLARYAALAAADPDLAGLRARLDALAVDPAAAASSPERAPPPPSTRAPDTDELVTVTLGNLYLLQGHRAEAERIFRRILRADPDNSAARQALARALGAGAPGGRQEI